MPLVQDRLLYLLVSSSVRYHCATDTPQLPPSPDQSTCTKFYGLFQGAIYTFVNMNYQHLINVIIDIVIRATAA